MKKLFAIFAACMMIMSLAACSDSGSSTPNSSDVSSSHQTSNYSALIDINNYIGYWEGERGGIEVFDDYTYIMTDTSGNVTETGSFAIDEGINFVCSNYDLFMVLDEDLNLYGGPSYGTYYKVGRGDAPEIPEDPDYPDDPVSEPDVPDYPDDVTYSPADFYGYWMYPDGAVLHIAEYDEWSSYDVDGTMMGFGYMEYDNSVAWLKYYTDDPHYAKVDFIDGVLYDRDVILTYYAENPIQYEEENDPMVGTWYYSAQGSIITCFEDGRFTWETEGNETEGNYVFDNGVVTFYYTMDGGANTGYFDPDGNLVIDGDEPNYYYPSDDF